MGAIATAWAIVQKGTLWSSTGKCKGFAVANPGEASKINSYVAALDTWTPGTPLPTKPTLATDTGVGLVAVLDALARKAPTPPLTVAIVGTAKPGQTLQAAVS